MITPTRAPLPTGTLIPGGLAAAPTPRTSFFRPSQNRVGYPPRGETNLLPPTSEDLPLLGRDFFDRPFELVEAVIPTGDQLNVDVWGALQEFFQLLVDDGNVSLPLGLRP